MVCVPEDPLKVTVPVPGLNAPPVLVQLPDTLNAPMGAFRVPEDKVTFVTFTSPVEPVNIPPDIVRPPLKLLVLVEARYVPPDIVVRPPTVTA